MKLPRRQTLVIALIFAAIFAGVLVLSERPVSYADLVNREQRFYVVLANACDSILRATPPDRAMPAIIPSSDKSVPLIVKDLHPTRIEVASGLQEGTNTVSRVQLLLGGNKQYLLTWQSNPADPTSWELVVTGDDGPVVLLAARKPPPAPQATND